MRYRLDSKSPIGEINRVGEDGKIMEEFWIGEGRFSITPKEDFFLLHFWVMAEYDVKLPDGKMILGSGPTMQVLTKIRNKLDNFQLEIPSRNDVEDEWDENYRNGYYNGWHNDLEGGILKVQKKDEDYYLIEFKGIPDQDYPVEGICELPLSDKLKRFW